MRMWMINPKLLCRKHLLGEHNEIHKHIPSFRKGHKIDGRFTPIVQIELKSLLKRHDELANEMLERGYNHKSPLENIPDLKFTYPEYYDKEVDIEYSLIDLYDRCENCRVIIDKKGVEI